jgi:heme exporter protein C
VRLVEMRPVRRSPAHHSAEFAELVCSNSFGALSADRAAGLLALVGVVNVPIIYFSVKWWNTLHQGASVSLTKSPSMASTMLLGMLVMALACWAYCIAAALLRVRSIIVEREAHTAWVQDLASSA